MLSIFKTRNCTLLNRKHVLTVVTACLFYSQAIFAEPSDVYSSIPGVDCVINPYKVADLASPVAGVIEDLYVERSQKVSAGQVVAQLDAEVEKASVKLARYRANIQSEIKLGQVNMDYDQRRKIRIDSLHDKQVASVEHTEEAEREEGLSKWKLQQAKELSEIRKLELYRAEQQLRQKSIRAPFNGFVLDTFKRRGEYVEDQSILRLAQLDPLVIEAIVPMENFGAIKVGMTGEIIPEFQTDKQLTGTVTIVDRIGDTASNTFGVRLVMSNPDNYIPAGLKCIVKFMVDDVSVDTAESAGVIDDYQMTEKALVEQLQARRHQQDLKKNKQMQATQLPPVLRHTEQDIEQQAQLDKPKQETDRPNSSPSSYLVMTEQGETDPMTRELIVRLKEAGIQDFHEIDHGKYKGLISLGLYNLRTNAKKRLQSLENLGFSSFISERY